MQQYTLKAMQNPQLYKPLARYPYYCGTIRNTPWKDVNRLYLLMMCKALYENWLEKK